jgi:hypothetical protein
MWPELGSSQYGAPKPAAGRPHLGRVPLTLMRAQEPGRRSPGSCPCLQAR